MKEQFAFMKFQEKVMEKHKRMNLLLLLLAQEVKPTWLVSAAWIDTSFHAMKMAQSASGMQRAANFTIELKKCTKPKSWTCNSVQIEHTSSLLRETSLQR